MNTPRWFLRYRRETAYGVQFAHIRYPWRHNVTHAQAEQMRASMPDPDQFEIVAEETA